MVAFGFKTVIVLTVPVVIVKNTPQHGLFALSPAARQKQGNRKEQARVARGKLFHPASTSHPTACLNSAMPFKYQPSLAFA